MDALANSPLLPEAKRQIRNMLGASANPDSGKIDVQIAWFPKEQQEKILRNANKMRDLRRNVTRRAREQLLDMSESEWNAMVEEANADE